MTMVLGGLWHGAAWTFVIWGVYQGVLLSSYRGAGDSGGSAAGSSGRSRSRGSPRGSSCFT